MAEKFTEKYMDIMFYTWFENSRPPMTRLKELIPEDENGKKPAVVTLQSWYTNYGWTQRADALDGQTSIQQDQSVIERRVKLYEELEQTARLTLEAGRSYIEEHGIQSDNAAIRAIVAGAEMLVQSVGVAAAFSKYAQMNSAQLEREFRTLLNRGQNEVEVLDDSDTVSTDEMDEEAV